VFFSALVVAGVEGAAVASLGGGGLDPWLDDPKHQRQRDRFAVGSESVGFGLFPQCLVAE
jgi:hypothetical protein